MRDTVCVYVCALVQNDRGNVLYDMYSKSSCSAQLGEACYHTVHTWSMRLEHLMIA